MNYEKAATIRISGERKRTEPEPKRRPLRKASMLSTPALSLLVAALLFASPSTNTNSNTNSNRNREDGAPQTTTIRYWAAEAMSPTVELTAAAAAAVVRRNVISGAAIFTVGDAAAQMLTASKSKKRKSNPLAIAIATTTPTGGIQIPDPETTAAKGEAELKKLMQSRGSRNATTKRIATAVSNLDANRLWSSMFLGAIWSGFCVPFIYGNVEKTFPGKGDLRQILLKVLVTCSILSTIGNYATMFSRRFISQYTTYQFDKASSLRLKWFSKPVESILLFLAIIKGCFKSCNRDIGEVIVDDLKIWPLYDLTCYSLISPTWRPITTSIMSSGWAMYMSVVSAKEENDEQVDLEEATQVNGASAAIVEDVFTTTIEPPDVLKPRSIQMTRLDPFPKPATNTNTTANTNTKPSGSIVIVSTSETTKKLIGVKGGEASPSQPNARNVPPPPPPISPPRKTNNCDDGARNEQH